MIVNSLYSLSLWAILSLVIVLVVLSSPETEASCPFLPKECGRVPLFEHGSGNDTMTTNSPKSRYSRHHSRRSHRRYKVGKSRIGGGLDAGIGEFPSFVKVFNHVPNSHPPFKSECGGALISDQYVITAGRCMEVFEGLVKVHIGVHRRSDLGEGLDVEKVCIMDNFVLGRRNDIAVIKLEKPIEFSDTVQPVCLPESDISIDDPVYAAGLAVNHSVGYLSRDKTYSESLQILPMKVVECERKRHTRVCYRAEEYIGHLCSGDIGGPIYAKLPQGHVLIGVHSATPSSPKSLFCKAGVSIDGYGENVFRKMKSIKKLLHRCR